MIKRIWLQNYGPFKRAELDLRPLTVIVGPNASGKSIALEALHRLGKPGEAGTPGAVLREMKNRTHDARDVEVGFERHDGSRGFWQSSSGDGPSLVRSDLDESPPETVMVRLDPDALRKASYIDAVEPLMKEDGYGMATILAYMKLSGNENLLAIEKRLRTIVPTFEGIRFKRTKVDGAVGDELVFDMKGARGLPPSAVSDGTLLTLGLLTILVEYSKRDGEAQQPKLFLIDELEHGLHPKALGELIAQLHQLVEDPNVQILATSHSPYLVDWLDPGEVRLTGFLEDGTATIRALEDHPDFERWKEEMSPGEFWSTVGEDWIA